MVPDWARAGITLSEAPHRAANGRSVTFDVYTPAGADSGQRRPVVIAIHGGSWYGGSRAAFRSDDPRNTIVRLVQRGCVVVAIDYPLARPGAPSWPAVISELREAVRWVRRHAAMYGADSERIALLGQSSGAHLAALLATLPAETGPDGVSSRVQAAVCFYGPFELARLASRRSLAHEPARILVGTSVAEGARALADASPLHHVSHDDPPMLLLHGTEDAWVPLEQSELMAESLTRAGVAHRLIVVAGARHGFEALFSVEHDFLPDVFAFLESAWNVSVEGPPAATTR
jgi:acetyl esterase/lipase